MKSMIFITGTGTGVGKTVLTALLAEFVGSRGLRVAALKPVCSGGRGDARRLHAALGGALSLDQVNPWHFRAAIAPLLAARRERKRVTLGPVLAHLRQVRQRFEVVLIEGAGGLLSPLGAGFNSRDLISALEATPIVVAPNQLGVVNHILLTLEALPEGLRHQAKVVLMSPPMPDSAMASNARLLRQLSVSNLCALPWFGPGFSASAVLLKPEVRKTLAKLLD
jgi:dethiobiotin synthetase